MGAHRERLWRLGLSFPDTTVGREHRRGLLLRRKERGLWHLRETATACPARLSSLWAGLQERSPQWRTACRCWESWFPTAWDQIADTVRPRRRLARALL